MKKNDSYGFSHRKLTLKCQILGPFDTSPRHQSSKFNNLLWVCWFSGKHISNFVSPDLKLHTSIAITCKYFLPTFVCSSQIHPYLCHWISVICLLKSRWFQWFKSKVEFHPSRTLKVKTVWLPSGALAHCVSQQQDRKFVLFIRLTTCFHKSCVY